MSAASRATSSRRPVTVMPVILSRPRESGLGLARASRQACLDEGARDLLEVMAGDAGGVTQRALAGEHGQPVHRGPDGVLDPGAALPGQDAGVGQLVEYGAQLIQGQGVRPALGARIAVGV